MAWNFISSRYSGVNFTCKDLEERQQYVRIRPGSSLFMTILVMRPDDVQHQAKSGCNTAAGSAVEDLVSKMSDFSVEVINDVNIQRKELRHY